MKKLIMVMFLVVPLIGCGTETANDKETNESNQNNEGNETNAVSEETVTFKLGHVSSETNGFHIASEYFAEKVAEKTNDTVQIDIYPSAQLGGDRDMMENISNGSQDMGFISLAIFSNITPIFEGAQLPFLIDNKDVEFELYQSETIQKALEELEEIDHKALAIVQNGFHQFATNAEPIESVEDLQGQTFRVGENEMLIDSYTALGLSATPMAYPEVYNALQTGVIDGGASQPSTWVTDGTAEVIKSFTDTLVYSWPGVITINLDKFNNLTAEQQAAIEESAQETQVHMKNVEQEMDEKAIQDMKDMGIKVIDDIDRAPFIEKMQPVYDKYAEKHPLIKETIETVKELNSN